MATVTLTRAFLSLASDPSDYFAAYTSERAEVQSLPGEVRRMANGRLRVITRAGAARTLTVKLPRLSPDEVVKVRSWLGAPVLFRDVWGRKMYGAYFDVQVTDSKDRAGQDVRFTLTEVSVSEAV